MRLKTMTEYVSNKSETPQPSNAERGFTESGTAHRVLPELGTL